MSKREFTKYPHHVDPYKKHRITDEELDFLQELQKEMNTQNTWAQADPRIWVIQEPIRKYLDNVETDLRNDPDTVEILNQIADGAELYVDDIHMATPQQLYHTIQSIIKNDDLEEQYQVELIRDYRVLIHGRNDLGEVVWDAKDARDGIVSIRKSNPELKIVLSVGGWGADGFSQAARTKEGRERFAASALAIVKEYGLDGIDIDWEYPGTSLAGIASDRSDKENYTLLLAELRKTLDAYREGMLVTTAVGGDVYFALQTDMKEASRYLDYVQLMTYDLQGGFQKVTGHHAALYHSEGNLFDACVQKAVNGFVNAGVPMEKLILGVPFYSRKWDGVKGAGCRNGLGMEAETVGGYGGDYGELKESWIGKRGFIRYWDEQAKVPYLFDGETFISYEDCESLGVKIAYLKEKGMGGIMFWEYKCDPSGELLSFIKKNM